MKKIVIRCVVTFIGGLICGVLAGGTAINALISYRIDVYHERIRYLESDIEDKTVKLKKYEDSINNKKFILRDIEIYLDYKDIEEDELDRITMEKSIKEKYKDLLGKEVKSIDIDLVSGVIDKRILKLDGREYQLKVEKILLSDVLKLWAVVNLAN